ncbi:hypothetical protein WICPIJ_008934 [Wickerhamomyces pijperi]|uniref:Uncharacterized protein n=1 Tax=Wickerhamomyces pijperi TaxID=599730 RepID=A0A9P8TGN5_WICPI|nr:hypothetical protein WICPIJ_008934 [Wickerhamomyces pijperi]
MILMPIVLDEEEKAISDELRSLILQMREIIICTSGSDLRLKELKEFSSFIESFITDYEKKRLPEFNRFLIEDTKKKIGNDNELSKDEIEQIKDGIGNSERLKNAIESNQTDDVAPVPISSLAQFPHSITDEMRRVLLESYPETKSRGCNVLMSWRSELTIDVFGDQRNIDRLSVGNLDVSVLSNQKERWCHVLTPETTDPTKPCLAQVLAILQVNDIIFVVGIIFPRAEFHSLDLSSPEDASRNDVNSRMLHLPGNTKGRLEILKIDSVISRCSLFN